MTKKTILVIIGVIIILALIVAISDSSKRNNGVIKIGVIDVLSGPYASMGENFQKGIELAQAEYPDKKIQLVFEDDSFESQKGLSAYKKLMDIDHVDALIVATSPTINVIYPEVSKQNIPVLTYGSQSIDETNDNVFHIYPSSVPVVEALGAYLKAKDSKVVSVYTNDSTILKFYSGFKQGFGSDIPEFAIDPNTKDVRTVAAKVLAEKPSYIFMSNFAGIGAQFIKELIDLSGGSLSKKGITLVFDLTFSEATSEYEKVLGDLKVLDGSIVVSLKAVNADDFTAKYIQKYNDKPGQLADYGFDSLHILMASYDADVSKWITNVGATNITGATGAISFDNVGRRVPIFQITTLKDGKVPEYK